MSANGMEANNQNGDMSANDRPTGASDRKQRGNSDGEPTGENNWKG